jgi:hypothetical protein
MTLGEWQQQGLVEGVVRMAEYAVQRRPAGFAGWCAVAITALLWLGASWGFAQKTATQTVRDVFGDLADRSLAEKITPDGCRGVGFLFTTSDDLLAKLGPGREMEGDDGLITWEYDDLGLAFRLKRTPAGSAPPEGEGWEVLVVEAVRISTADGGRIGGVCVGSTRERIDEEFSLPFVRRRGPGWGIELDYFCGGLTFGLDPRGETVEWIEIRRPIELLAWDPLACKAGPQVTYQIAYEEETPSRAAVKAVAALHTLFSYTTTFRHEFTDQPAGFTIGVSRASVETFRDFWLDTYDPRRRRDRDDVPDRATVRNRYSASVRLDLTAYDRAGEQIARCEILGGGAIYSPVSRLEGIAAAGAAAAAAAMVREGQGEIAGFIGAIRDAFPCRAPVLSLDREQSEAIVALDPQQYPVTRFDEIRLRFVMPIPRPGESAIPFADRQVQWAPIESRLSFVERTESGASRWRIAGEEWLACAPDPASGFLWAEAR